MTFMDWIWKSTRDNVFRTRKPRISVIPREIRAGLDLKYRCRLPGENFIGVGETPDEAYRDWAGHRQFDLSMAAGMNPFL